MICTQSLSKQSLKNLKYFGISDLIRVPSLLTFQTSEAIVQHWEAFLSSTRVEKMGIRTRGIIGIRGEKPSRAGHAVFQKLSNLLQQYDLKTIGPIGILHDQPEDWLAFDAQIELAKSQSASILVASPKTQEITGTYKMIQLLQSISFPTDKCIFQVRQAKLIEPILRDGFGCAIQAQSLRSTDLLPFQDPSHCLQICSNIDANHHDLLVIPKLHDHLIKNEFSSDFLRRIFYENCAKFYNLST